MRGRRAACVAAALIAGPAVAHVSGERAGEGLPIAAITHGQMPVIADHAGAIIALALRQPHADEDFRRVLGHARLQRAFCLWGMAPGAISDEASPFNACSHAWLAAARDLLLRMAAQPDDAEAAALVRRVERDMMQSATALELCSYSDAAFDTATIIGPRWADVAVHPPSLAGFGALGVLLSVALARFLRWAV